jgi:cell division protease FtsH
MPDPKNQKGQEEPGQKAPQRSRGIGGVLMIMALLALLFLVVSQTGLEQPSSIYDFYRRLFLGQLRSLEIQEQTVVATYREDDLDRKLEVELSRFAERDLVLMRELQALSSTVERNRYKGIDQFLADVDEGRVSVKSAWFVHAHGNPASPAAAARAERGLDPGAFVSAVVQQKNNEALVIVWPAAGDQRSLQDLRARLLQKAVTCEDRALSRDRSAFVVKTPNTALIYFLSSVAPYLLVLILVWFFIFRQMRSPGAGGVLSFGRSRAALYTKENRTNVTFDDVAGIEEAKDEVAEIVEFLKNPQRFAKLGGRIPRGVLLVGSPGTGKTLLAKAIAGEAEVPFFSISGSDFVEMFVGVGASRVRDLFKQARECSPCLVFLDEIDAVGRKRGSGMGGGHDEREQTLNAILVEMDGFDSDKGIILIGATNRPDVLDPALLRPGRFDRQIVIDMPDVKGREAILRVHARKVKLAPLVDLHVVARATAAFSGADLAAVMNEAAILAAMKGKEAIELGDLEEARDRVKWGREKKSRALEEEDRRVTAWHEAGHALVSTLTKELDPLHKVTIVSRGMALGITMSLPERDDYHLRKRRLLGMIAMCYGGRAAEEAVFGDVSAGAQNDIERATEIARMMVCEFGMSEALGPVRYSVTQESPFLGRELKLAGDLSPHTLELIDGEVRAILDAQYARARQMMQTHRQQLDAIAHGLLKHETLTGDEVLAIVRGDDLDEFRATRQRLEQQALEKAVPGRQKTPLPDQGEPGIADARGLQPS